MQKLAAVRAALLASDLRLSPEHLLTFAEQGHVTAWRGDRNRTFSVAYDAHLIVTDFRGDPRALLFLVLGWLHREEPAAKPDAVAFHVDVIDHRRVDVSLRLPLTETVTATDGAGGVTLTTVADPDALAIDMGALFPDMPQGPLDA